MGIAAYGKAWTVTDYKADGGAEGATSGIFQTGTPDKSWSQSNTVQYNLIEGKLNKADGFVDYYDDCTESPYIYNEGTGSFITCG